MDLSKIQAVAALLDGGKIVVEEVTEFDMKKTKGDGEIMVENRAGDIPCEILRRQV
jgi:hypothetical protein